MGEKTAVIYARVSTARQAEDELPLDSQLAQCQARADELDAHVVKVFTDGGKSGTTDERPAFQDAVAFCELYAPDYFITWSTSRFARNRLDAGLYKRRLDRAGTQIYYISTPVERGTDAGYMLEGLHELFDEYYSRTVAADARRSMMKNARDGYWNGGVTPYGYASQPAGDGSKRKRLGVVEAEADNVRRIFELRLQGHGAFAIAQALNEQGAIARKGRPWTKKGVLGVLRSEAVIGNTVFNKYDRRNKRTRPRDQWITIPSHPAIIERDQWEAVQVAIDGQSQRAENRTAANSSWRFSGLLKCGQCGASLQIETGLGRSKRYNYYICSRSKQVGDCKGLRLPAEAVDEWLLEEVLDKILSRESLAGVVREIKELTHNWQRDNRRKTAKLARQREDVAHKVTKIYELFELFGKDTPNLGDLTQRLRKHNATIKNLESQIAALETETPPEIDVDDIEIDTMAELTAQILRTAEDAKRVRTFLGTFIKAIKINGQDVEIEYDKALLVNQTDAVQSKRRWWAVGAALGTGVVSCRMPFKARRRATALAGQSAV